MNWLLLLEVPVLGVALWVAVQLALLLSTKRQSTMFSLAMARLNDAAQTTVKEVQQTLAHDFKMARVEQRLKGDTAAELRSTAIKIMYANLGPLGLHELRKALGLKRKAPLDRLLVGRIEAAGGWTTLRHLAGFLPELTGSEQRISEKLKFLLHVDDAERLEVMRTLQAEERGLLMLGYQLFDDAQDKFTAAEVAKRFTAPLRQELKELAEVLSQKAHAKNVRVRDGWPLGLHRTYSRREILTALGHWNSQQKRKSREGTLALDAEKTELFFVTIDKNAKRFTERTSYHDYAISDALFHWESQNKTSDTTRVGERYIEQSKNGWMFLLFVRETEGDNYVFLGPVHYVSHTGNKPMQITWKMEHLIPFWVQEFCENPRDRERTAI